MRNFVQAGSALDMIAPSGGVVAGVGVLIGAIFGVAATTAAEGEIFSLSRRGVFDLAAATHASNQALAAGDPAYWDNTNKVITATAAGNTLVGVVTEAKVSTVAIARVALVERIAPSGTAIADLAGGADLAATIAKVNVVIAALETAGVIKA